MLRFNPKSVLRIQSGFLLYIERISVRLFAGIADYVKKKQTKRPLKTFYHR